MNEYYGKLKYDWQVKHDLTLPTYPLIFDTIKFNNCTTAKEIADLIDLHVRTVERAIRDMSEVGLVQKVYIAKGEHSEL